MKNTKKHIVLVLLSATVLLGGASGASAASLLSLDIGGGTYDTNTNTIIAQSDIFTLYALLNTTGKTADQITELLGDTFFISAAVVPKTKLAADLGSFIFNGTTVNVTGDMVFGLPPIENAATSDTGDLGTHNIFKTYFTELPALGFLFDPMQTATPYDPKNTPGAGPTQNPTGAMYYAAFTVDSRNLAENIYIHFDLYSKYIAAEDVEIENFAPFNRDAQTPAPEPASLLLLGTGLSGLAAWGYRRKHRG